MVDKKGSGGVSGYAEDGALPTVISQLPRNAPPVRITPVPKPAPAPAPTPSPSNEK